MFVERRNRRRVRDLVEISGFLEVAIEQLEKLEKETLSEIGSNKFNKQLPLKDVKVKQEIIKIEDENVSISSQLSGDSCLDTSLGRHGNARNSMETSVSTRSGPMFLPSSNIFNTQINEPRVCLEEQEIKKEIILPKEGKDQTCSSFQDHFSLGTAGVALDCLIQRTSTSQSSSDMGGPSGINSNRLSSDIAASLGINMNCEFSNHTETRRLRSGSKTVSPSGITMNCGFYNPAETSRLSSDISGPSTGNGNSIFGNPNTSRLSSDISGPSTGNGNSIFGNPNTSRLSSDISGPSTGNGNSIFGNPNTSRLSSEIAGPPGFNMNFRENTSHSTGNKNNGFSKPSETNRFRSDSAGHSVVNKNSGVSNPFESFRFSYPSERFRSDIESDHSTVNKNGGFSNPFETNIFRSDIADHSAVNKNNGLSELEIHNINNPKKNTSAQPSSYKSIEKNDDKATFKVLIKFKTNLTPQEIAHILMKNGITDIKDIFIRNLTKAYITFSKKDQFMINSEVVSSVFVINFEQRTKDFRCQNYKEADKGKWWLC